MTRKEAFETLKENLCGMCAYGSQCMESCDIRSCDNRDAIKTLEQTFCKNTEYKKDLNEMKEQILKEGDTLVSKRDLLERFCEIDKEYKGRPWNLLQILANINILIGEEPCEDCISRQAVLNTLFYKSDNNCEVVLNKELQDRIKALPHVTPTHKEWIPVPEGATNKDVFKAVFGYEPATDAVVCNKADWCGDSEPCNYCISNPDNIGREEQWWNAPYKAESEE